MLLSRGYLRCHADPSTPALFGCPRCRQLDVILGGRSSAGIRLESSRLRLSYLRISFKSPVDVLPITHEYVDSVASRAHLLRDLCGRVLFRCVCPVNSLPVLARRVLVTGTPEFLRAQPSYPVSGLPSTFSEQFDANSMSSSATHICSLHVGRSMTCRAATIAGPHDRTDHDSNDCVRVTGGDS